MSGDEKRQLRDAMHSAYGLLVARGELPGSTVMIRLDDALALLSRLEAQPAPPVECPNCGYWKSERDKVAHVRNVYGAERDALRQKVERLEKILSVARGVVTEQQEDGSGHPEDVEALRNVIDGRDYMVASEERRP